MHIVAHYIVFAMKNESIMVNNKTSDIVLLLFIVMHNPTIYLICPPRGTSKVYQFIMDIVLPLNVYSQNDTIAQ